MRVVPFTAIPRQVEGDDTRLMKSEALVKASRVSGCVRVQVDGNAVLVGPLERPCRECGRGPSATIPLKGAKVAEY